MSVSLDPTGATDHEVELVGHDYRLSEDQFRRATEAGIIDGDAVEFQDGILCRKLRADDPRRGEHQPLSLDQYRAMISRDILTTDDRIELLEGWLVAKMSKNPPHSVCKGLTYKAIQSLLPREWFIAVEDPVTAIDSEPEPDLSVIRGDPRDYLDQAPGPQQVGLLIEVANASLARDRSMKKRLYARSGFAVYWLINLVDRRVEVYTQPTGPIGNPDYLHRQDFGPGDQIPLILEGVEAGRIAVADLLP